MNGEKTTLPSLRNIEKRTVKTETEKINQALPYISTNNITELNALIYTGEKLVCEKIGIPSKSTKKKIKTRKFEMKISTKTGQNHKTKERRWNKKKRKRQHKKK